MDTLKHYYELTVYNIHIALLTIVEYKTELLGWLISNPIQFVVGFATIQFVVNEFGSIDGWNYGQLAFLYGLSVISHALSMIFFVRCWFMGYFILDGDFDRYMVRPVSVLYQFLFGEFNVIGLTDLIPGICVFIYGCIKVSFHWTLGSALLILVTILGATLIRGGIYLFIGTIAFFAKGLNDLGGLTQELFDRTTMYPLSMYPRALQFILTFLIPIGWVSFYPASSLLHKTTAFPASLSFLTLLIGIIVLGLASLFFKSALRRYESAGN